MSNKSQGLLVLVVLALTVAGYWMGRVLPQATQHKSKTVQQALVKNSVYLGHIHGEEETDKPVVKKKLNAKIHLPKKLFQ